MKSLYEILVPTKFEDTKTPIRTRYHKKFDEVCRKYSDGLSIFKPIMGQWLHKGELYEDRMIPVRLVCTRNELNNIMKFAKDHYRQIQIMAYKISDEVIFYGGNTIKCPSCGQKTDGDSAHGNCCMVKDRRGGWRQLGVYDG
jgi:hypothetical protein